MGIPIDELMLRLSSRNVAEYMADYMIEPWGGARADLQAAIIASTVAQANSKRLVKMSDFIIDYDKPEPGDIEAKAMGLAMQHNATVKERKKRNGNNR